MRHGTHHHVAVPGRCPDLVYRHDHRSRHGTSWLGRRSACMLWIDDGKGGGECTVGLMRLSVYISPTSGGRCFRVAFRHGEEWDTYAWGSTELACAEAREFAENVAREAVTNGALRGDTSADAVMAKIALFSPVIGDELESIRRTMIEVVDELVSDAVRSEVALAMSTSKPRWSRQMDIASIVVSMVAAILVLVSFWSAP